MTIDRSFLGSLRFAAGITFLLALTPPAKAQWGIGYGWGMMGVGPSPSTQLLNDHAMARTGIAAARQPGRSHSPYSSNPNAYFNRIRDNGFTSHYDVRRRRAPSYQPVRAASLGNGGRTDSRPAQPAPAPAPVVALASFFDGSLALVWPQESPIDGEFKEKRDLSDRASLIVLKQTKDYGSAPITSVTEARQKLIDYGRPALNQLRTMTTPPIADSFHRFLLSLYDSLEASAWPPEAAPVSQP
jgi:hypothetical protein